MHVLEILTTKFAHWSYEEEYRVFPKLNEHDKRALYFYNSAQGLDLKEMMRARR